MQITEDPRMLMSIDCSEDLEFQGESDREEPEDPRPEEGV